MRFPSPSENRLRLRLRRQNEMALVVVAFVIKRMQPSRLDVRERRALFGMIERHVRQRLVNEGWREYA